jgi:hypothetical protein
MNFCAGRGCRGYGLYCHRSASLFDWDDENEQHLWRDGISREEAEAALRDPWLHPAPTYRARTE